MAINQLPSLLILFNVDVLYSSEMTDKAVKAIVCHGVDVVLKLGYFC